MLPLHLLLFAFDLVVPAKAAISAATSNFTVAAGWYPGYHFDQVPLSSVLWNKYTHLIYAFATPTEDPNSISLVDSDAELLPQFVAAAHKNGVAAGLSIGGWGGSTYFSSNVATPANRTAFVKSVVGLIEKYQLDLIDFDWEFPGMQGIGCNLVSENDTENLLLMLRELKASPQGSKVSLSAATSVQPFPTTNTTLVSQFASVLNWITPMVYDLSWNWTAGSRRLQRALPSAPLDDSCFSAASGENITGLGSAKSAVEAWVGAGIPRNQIALGVPAYGHSFDVNRTTAFLTTPSLSSGLPSMSSSPLQLVPYPVYDTLNHTPGDAWDGTGGINQCGVYTGPGGTFAFFSLISAKYLLANGSIAPGIPYRWDECSQTPYLYAANHGKQGVLISYVDPRSFGVRGQFVKANNLAGFSMWEVGGDPQGLLVDAILSATTNASLTVSPSASAAHGAPTPGSSSASRRSASMLHLGFPFLAGLLAFVS
ncbi:Chitinase [Mycena indigotica]|uniref:Chitinase n=1 Tax=Mycena indigotica TaxID=2126181 RepID=A0A8H6TBV2_9AGAR|nr:Chitinase [Mycena indigotica]KAF7315905.1 Chitinase [Mycena indigotica]